MPPDGSALPGQGGWTPRVLSRRLSALDASFLYIETPEAPLHLGGVEVFDGPLSRETLMARLAERLDEIPRYRQRVVAAPFGLGLPFWDDAPAFDLRNHVLETAVGPPGDDGQLAACAARIIEVPLSRQRPLWELHVVHGLQGDRSALVLKVHHAMVDGISGVEMLDVLFDPTPDGQARLAPARVHVPAPTTETTRLFELVRDAAAGTWELGVGAVRGIAQLLSNGGPGLERCIDLAGALGCAAVEPVVRLPFNRALTGQRRLSWLTLALAPVREVRAAQGGTVNDVLLAVITDAVGRFLRDAGELTSGRWLRLMVPVNVRREDESGRLGNRVSMIPVEAPFDAGPLERLQQVQVRTERLKRAGVADAVGHLVTAGALLPAPLHAGLLALAANPSVLAWSAPLRSLPPLVANVVCTNVPGPQAPLYAQGRRMVAHYPIVPLAFEFGLGVAIFSYDRQVFVGLIADGAAIDDVAPLARHVERAFEDLCAATGVMARPSATGIGVAESTETSRDADNSAVPTSGPLGTR